MDEHSRPRTSEPPRLRTRQEEVATMIKWPGSARPAGRTGSPRMVLTRRNRASVVAVAVGTAVTLAAAGCSSSGGGPAGKQVPASARQTIVFATQGLGAEGTATAAAVKAFEKLHPDTGAFFPGQMATGQYKGGIYAIPWFINAEGLYYRTDLIKTPPTTAAQLFRDALAAMKADPKLREGLAFEGDKYEGAVTAFQSFGGQISSSSLSNINTPANTGVLTLMYDAVHKAHIAPTAVSTWEESQVQSAWLSGQTPFALNWPYIFALSQGSNTSYPAVKNKTGWVPFPNPMG